MKAEIQGAGKTETENEWKKLWPYFYHVHYYYY